MTQSYSSTIKNHYHHPRNSGKLSNPTHTAEALNPLCGDETKVYLKIRKGLIEDIAHETHGCMICVAAASAVSEFAKGKKLSEIKKLDLRDIAKFLEVSISPARTNCARLFLEAIWKTN